MMAMQSEAQQVHDEHDRGSGDDHCKQDLVVAAKVHAKPDRTEGRPIGVDGSTSLLRLSCSLALIDRREHADGRYADDALVHCQSERMAHWARSRPLYPTWASPVVRFHLATRPRQPELDPAHEGPRGPQRLIAIAIAFEELVPFMMTVTFFLRE